MLRSYMMFIRFLGELTGTTMLVCLGCMSCIKGNDSLASGLNFALVVTTAMQCFGFVSGAHINPCVSLSSFVLGYMPASVAALYVVAQLLGALLGFGLLTLLVPQGLVYGSEPGLCMTVPLAELSSAQAVGVEFVLTATLIFSWCAWWDVRNVRFLDSGSLRMGLLTMCLLLAGGFLTGASMNPARSLAPAVFHRKFDHVWMYFAGQLAAAIVVPVAWMLLFTPRLWRLPNLSVA